MRNGADRVPGVIRSVLAQDQANLELVISDNASTDETEEVCRAFAASDPRVVYHRHAEDVGLLQNFVTAMRISRGPFFRWVGDDDWLPPNSISTSVARLVEDEGKILATTRVAYVDEDGNTSIDAGYDGVRLASADPLVRFREILRLLNESRTLIDPMYGLFRRDPVAAIPRRNMLKEDEVFAAKLALAGPWTHVPEVLVHRRTRSDRLSAIARRLGVPAWHVHAVNTLQCREILRWLRHTPLTPEQRRGAMVAVGQMFVGRQRRTAAHRARKLARMAARRDRDG